MNGIRVTFENFPGIESERMFAGIATASGGTNRWSHFRTPTPVDEQTIIRMNRDTLYSAAIIDVSAGATITLPDAGERYMSVMLVNADHYINRILHSPGVHELTAEDLGSDFVLAATRILVDPEDAADVATVNALQDQLALTSVAGGEFSPTAFDEETFTRVRESLIELAKGLAGLEGCFGRKEDVDPIRHLLGTASAWGGLPETEASYINVDPQLPVGAYELTVGEVPVDGFWSITLYNADGYLDENAGGGYSVNSITSVKNADGTVTVRFGGPADAPNHLTIMEGWNYLVRLYRPRPETLNGSWSFPEISG